MKRLLFAFSVVMSLNAFAQNTSPWKVQYVAEGDAMTNAKAKKSEVFISIPDKKISGTFGCNSFTGNFESTKGDNIKPIKVVNTQEKCPPTADPLDNAFLKALKATDKVVIKLDFAKFYQGTKLLLELKR